MHSKIAVVTGASSGIGNAAAARLAQAGFKVYGAGDTDATKGACPYQALPLDVTREDSVHAAIAHVIRQEGHIDLLVNNARVGVAPAGAEESSLQQAQAVFDTNFFGLLRMTRAVLPHMRSRGKGRIINIGSVVGARSIPYGALYSAARHAIDGYTASLDRELRDWGIRAIVIEPAYTGTSFDAHMLEPDAKLDAYLVARTVVTRRVRDIMTIAEGPEVVADAVLKAALAKRPRPRYAVGGVATRMRLLRAFTSEIATDSGTRKDVLNAPRAGMAHPI